METHATFMGGNIQTLQADLTVLPFALCILPFHPRGGKALRQQKEQLAETSGDSCHCLAVRGFK